MTANRSDLLKMFQATTGKTTHAEHRAEIPGVDIERIATGWQPSRTKVYRMVR
jgi:hypothetical protein